MYMDVGGVPIVDFLVAASCYIVNLIISKLIHFQVAKINWSPVDDVITSLDKNSSTLEVWCVCVC